MKKTDNDFIRLMREEWNAKMSALAEEVELAFKAKVDGDNKSVVGPGLKVRGIEDQVLYTVTAVSMRGADLRPPEGASDGSQDFFVDKETLEKNYELD